MSAPTRLARLAAAVMVATLAALPVDVAPADSECPRWRAAFAGMPVVPLIVETPRGPVTLRVRAATEPEQQMAGFQCATVPEIHQHLILFDFGGEILTRFHMNNVPAPLDIAFVKADGRIFAILRMDPSPTALYGPLGAFRYALEARAGFFAEHGVTQGSARLLLPR